MNSMYRPRRGLRGASLVEALVALLVMAFGMMGVAGIQGRLRYSGDAAKQRAEATRIATAEMERLRGFASLAAVADDGVLQFDEIVSEVTQLAAPSTEYRIDRAVNALSDGSLDINLNISWLDRTKDDEDTPMSVNWRAEGA
jgi:K+-sensing histidine kinase KdpD